jgi:P27 family predicted phage terminase small subunit
MARHPEPTALKLLKGTDKKNPQRINKREPKPSGPLGAPPSNFTAAEKRIWKTAPRWAAKEDRDMWISYCRLRAEADRLKKVCEKEGVFVTGGNGQKKAHPAHDLFLKYEDRANKLAGLFGMTPSDRTKIQVEPEPDEDPFAGMLDV